MSLSRKATYNLFRMKHAQRELAITETWQVEDLRKSTLEDLLARASLTREEFIDATEGYDSPEDLAEVLFSHLTPLEYDKKYLLLFELWRRLVPEKRSISLLCDELDYQIALYDTFQLHNLEPLQDALGNIYEVLEENEDHGVDPEEAFEALSSWCASDLGSFLYDYISDQINLNDRYAEELVEDFYPYVKDKRRFDFLKAQIAAESDFAEANRLIHGLRKKYEESQDLELNFDILTFMVQGGEYPLFLEIVEETLNLIDEESDFIELVLTAADFFCCLDQEDIQKQLEKIAEERTERLQNDTPFALNDPHVTLFRQLMRLPLVTPLDMLSEDVIEGER